MIETTSPDIQAGILKGHGRLYRFLVYLRLDETEIISERFRRWLGEFSTQNLTSHDCQLKDTEKYKIDKRERPVTTIGLTYYGLRMTGKLDPSDHYEKEFRYGMRHSSYANQIHDYQVNYEDVFDVNLPGLVRAVVIIAANCRDVLGSRIKEFRESLRKHQLDGTINFKVHCIYRGIDNEQPDWFVGPFGYRDGLSEHRKIGDLLGQVCVREKNGGYGSYMAVRMMEVDRKAFGNVINLIKGPQEFSEAVLMGRFKNGTPLLLSNNYGALEENEWRETIGGRVKKDKYFDYKGDERGARCPLGAHVRKMNSRVEKSSPLMLRRSGLYQDPRRLPEDRDYLKAKGLYFISYQRSITEQFTPLLVDGGLPYPDLITYRDRQNDELPIRYFYDSIDEFMIYGESVTKYRGGEFFYFASPKFLYSL